jgi:signal peptidase II
MPPSRPVLILGTCAALLALAGDQLSKHAVLAHFRDDGDAVALLPHLNIILVSNHGVSFGLFNEHGMAAGGGWQSIAFSILALVVVAGLSVALWRTRSLWSAAGFGLIIGGAIGNLVDRLRLGSVVDFIDFFIGHWHWYTFNVADAAICTGVGLLLLDSLLTRSESPRA